MEINCHFMEMTVNLKQCVFYNKLYKFKFFNYFLFSLTLTKKFKIHQINKDFALNQQGIH